MRSLASKMRQLDEHVYSVRIPWNANDIDFQNTS